ncbi:MAG TPA: hypothetical protein VMV29_00335 [Ktedonobacterales bacterium]|nr:hypothetical protein [Ktedonobacterales bacterium]
MAIASLAITTHGATPSVRAYTWSPEPGWLHTLGQIAGTLLLLELMLALVLVVAIAGGLAFVAYWTHKNVVPVIGDYSARAKQVVDMGARAGDRVVEGVAEFHGRRMGLETALRVFFLGPQAADGLARRAPTQAPLASEAPDAIARPVTTETPRMAPIPIRPTQPTQPTGEPHADRRSPRIAPSPAMALRETPPIAHAPEDQPAQSAAPITPANALRRATPLAAPAPLRPSASTLPIGRAGTPGGLRAGIAGGVGFLGS